MYKSFIVKYFIFACFLLLSAITNALKSGQCSVPEEDEWSSPKFPSEFSNDISSESRLHRNKLKWPHGKVFYKLHDSLTPEDRVQVQLAMDEYHEKTCIRFEKWTNEPSFVSIEVDNTICGNASVCMKDGYRYARFGQDCRNKATMVHELGHTLCLRHEHQRPDREDYASYSGCELTTYNEKKEGHAYLGIYDYLSQMHYSCGDCFGGVPLNNWPTNLCGEQVHDGLSVLDVDHVNELYNCHHSCKRHRWEPITTHTWADLFDFGMADEGGDGEPLYPCRAPVNGRVYVGMYSWKLRACRIQTGSGHVDIRENGELLKIPGGLTIYDDNRRPHYTYRLKNSRLHSDKMSKVAVPAGHGFVNDEGYKPLYIAFLTISKNQKDGDYMRNFRRKNQLPWYRYWSAQKGKEWKYDDNLDIITSAYIDDNEKMIAMLDNEQDENYIRFQNSKILVCE